MSKLDAIGAKSLEEILASIRKTLSGDGSDASSGQRGAAPMPAPATPEPKAPADAGGDDDGLLSARLAGALSGPVNGAALDDDFSELLAPEHKEPAPSDPAGATKPGEARSGGKDPLWFLKQPSAAGESNGSQAPTAGTQPGEAAPAPADEVKLSRPEVLRASLPPLFGAAEERPTIFRTAPKAPDTAAPAAKMPPVTPAPSEVAKTAAGSVHTARTQPSMPPAQPADETVKAAPPPSAPPMRTDAGPSETVPTAPAAREPALAPEVAPAPVAEAAPGPQPLPEAKPVNGSLGGVAADTTANKVPTLAREPSATKPAPTADATQARTLEQVVGELLEPVIRHWLETNLPRMVEKVVRDEVARALAAERRAAKA